MLNSRFDVIFTPQKLYLDWFWGYIYPRGYAAASGVFRNMKRRMPGGAFQVYVFKCVQILAHKFVHIKYYYRKIVRLQRGSQVQGPP